MLGCWDHSGVWFTASSLWSLKSFSLPQQGLGYGWLRFVCSFQYSLCGLQLLPFCHVSVTQRLFFSCPGASDHLPSLWRHDLSPPLSVEKHIMLQAIWEQTVQNVCHNLFVFSFRIWYLDHRTILLGKMIASWFNEQKSIIYLTIREKYCFLFVNPLPIWIRF